jgi:uncharacterized protein DUF6491
MKHQTMLLWTMLALAGCASSLASRNQERLKLYQAHSTPVESFRITRLQGRQTRWSPIGDQALMVYDEADQPLLLELPQKCSGLATARSVSITNAYGTVTPGSDSVQLMSPSKAGSAYFCRIGSARRIDMDAIEEAREEMRAADPVERDPGASAEGKTN